MSTAFSSASMMDNSYGAEHLIPVNALQVDTAYQRPLNVTRAAKIAKAFDFELAGRLIVNQREDGSYWIVDGQHRLAAMRMRKIALAPCVVYSGWSAEHEARVFYETNTSIKKPTAFERFRAGLLIGDPVAVGINHIVQEIGGEITEKHPEGGTPNRIAAIEALSRIYRTKAPAGGPDRLREVLQLIMDAWGHVSYDRKAIPRQATPFNGDLVLGLAAFIVYAEGDPNYSAGELSSTLVHSSPTQILQDASQSGFASRGALAHAVAYAVRKEYNKGKRSKRIREDRPISEPFTAVPSNQ